MEVAEMELRNSNETAIRCLGPKRCVLSHPPYSRYQNIWNIWLNNENLKNLSFHYQLINFKIFNNILVLNIKLIYSFNIEDN